MRILRREDAAGQQICAHLSPKDADGANPHWNVLYGLALAGLLSSGADLPTLGRELSPANDARTITQLYRLMRRERPDVVHTHTAKAGTVGRIAAWLAKSRSV